MYLISASKKTKTQYTFVNILDYFTQVLTQQTWVVELRQIRKNFKLNCSNILNIQYKEKNISYLK